MLFSAPTDFASDLAFDQIRRAGTEGEKIAYPSVNTVSSYSINLLTHKCRLTLIVRRYGSRGFGEVLSESRIHDRREKNPGVLSSVLG